MSAFEREFHCGPEDVDESAGLSEHLADNRATEEWQERKHVARGEVLATYTLQFIGSDWLDWSQRDLSLLQMLRETEENLTDLLPDGYRVEVKEWDR